MPIQRAWIGVQGTSHTNVQSKVSDCFFNQGGKLFFPSCRIDSYFNLFHMFAYPILEYVLESKGDPA